MDINLVDDIWKKSIFRAAPTPWACREDKQLSKARKQSREKSQSNEIFADDEFDSEEFVEHMEDKGASHKPPQTRGGWRRLEELKEQKMLKNQLLELKDWDEFEEP
jgi:hypothetical protein